MKYCSECGYRLETEEKNCPLCGRRLKMLPATGKTPEPLKTHVHTADERCILPNWETPRRKATTAAKRKIYRPLCFVLALFFSFSALISLMTLLLGIEHLSSFVFSGALALLFWGLALTPRGAETVSLGKGRQVPVKQFALTLVLVAFVGALLLDIILL